MHVILINENRVHDLYISRRVLYECLEGRPGMDKCHYTRIAKLKGKIVKAFNQKSSLIFQSND